MNLLDFLQDERPESEKGRVIRIREPPLFVLVPPPRKRPILVPVKVHEKSSETQEEKPGDVNS